MRIDVSGEIADILERERVARGLCSRSQAAVVILREAGERRDKMLGAEAMARTIARESEAKS